MSEMSPELKMVRKLLNIIQDLTLDEPEQIMGHQQEEMDDAQAMITKHYA